MSEGKPQDSLFAYPRLSFESNWILMGNPSAQVKAINSIPKKVGPAKEHERAIKDCGLLTVTEQCIFEIVAVCDLASHDKGYLGFLIQVFDLRYPEGKTIAFFREKLHVYIFGISNLICNNGMT